MLVIVVSDTHGGHKHGLCPPDIVLYDRDEEGTYSPYTPELTDIQEYLWELNLEAIEKAIELSEDKEAVLLHLGEQTHGNKYSSGLMSNRLSDQLVIGRGNFIPWIESLNPVMLRMCIGTDAHEFDEGSATIELGETLQKEYPEIDLRVVDHGLLEVSGAFIDYRHHGPGGGIRNWTKGNVARHYLRSLMLDEIVYGRRPPDLVLCGHYHTKVNEVVTVGNHESRLVVMPSMCGLSGYARQVTKSAYIITNGIAFFHVEDGEVSRPIWVEETLDIRTKETVICERKSKKGLLRKFARKS